VQKKTTARKTDCCSKNNPLKEFTKGVMALVKALHVEVPYLMTNTIQLNLIVRYLIFQQKNRTFIILISSYPQDI
jgi:hypothetical protein